MHIVPELQGWSFTSYWAKFICFPRWHLRGCSLAHVISLPLEVAVPFPWN